MCLALDICVEQRDDGGRSHDVSMCSLKIAGDRGA
jgi:hypothetical protein